MILAVVVAMAMALSVAPASGAQTSPDDPETTVRPLQVQGTTSIGDGAAPAPSEDVTAEPLPAASPPPPPPQAGAAGLVGRVVIGPTCPVQRAGDAACQDRPYPTTVVIQTIDGTEVARIATDADGGFAVALGPGDYLVQALRRGTALARSQPVLASVGATGSVQVIIALDSGIR